ncbi:hypothetical protein, partial, partial [Parasitella parasitica]
AQQALNNQFRQEVNDLHSVISNLEKLVRSPTTVPADSSPIVNPAVFTTPAQPAQPQHLGPQPPQWTQILQRAAPANPKRRREHAIRVLHPPALPPIIPPMMLFIYTVLTQAHTRCNFPGSQHCNYLDHTDYRDDILQRLTEGGLTAIPDYDSQHVADPKFADFCLLLN